ncbi:MAG: LysM peptidoglycan-binding domain-containing protein [Chloroflexi bacterium]|nr:LysM peptidoglycan-binding domain-containing protein [Chloroflexota bacterium]
MKLSTDVPISSDLSKPPYTFALAIPPFDIPGIDALDNLVPGGGLGQMMPTDLQLPQLTLSGLTFSARSGKDGGITAIAATVSLKAKTSWTIISGALVVDAGSVPLGVTYNDKTQKWEPALTIQGEFSVGSGDPPPLTSVVEVKLPDQTLEVRLKQDTHANLLKLIDQFLGVAGIPFPAESFGLEKLDIDEFELKADKKKQTFSLKLGVSTAWKIELPPVGPVFELDTVNVSFERTSNTAPLTLDATMSSPLDMTAEAARDAKGAGWALSLTQTKPASTQTLASRFGDASWVVGPLLPTQFDGIQLKLDTGTYAYSVKGGATWNLAPNGGEALSIRAALDLASELDTTKQPAVRTYTGNVSGTLTVFKFEASVAYRFGPDDTNLTYTIAFRGATLRAVRAIDSKAETDTLTVTLTGVTVGGVIDELVSLVVPDLGFTLSPPWDALSSVSLDGVSLIADLKKSTVAVSARIGLDLGFASLNSVTLTYGTAADGAASVAISVDGSFVGLPAEPVGWDLLNDPAPTPPAASPPLVDLAFLGIGQNYGFTSATAPATITDVIAALEREFLDSGPGSGLAFTGTGNWLIGLDITLMGAVRIEIVFDDPVLYGIRIALSGEKVKSLAGLEFEILYRRISDTLGVYQIELTLPEKFRQMQFGAVSVTLPIVDIDIYTNGNFRLDFGFPVAGDFSRSFCVQAGPFIGYGGFYFALLDGQTSTRVPQITNGAFNPVIEFGLALSVGLGRTFDKGPLKAEATLTFEAILEGALAWFQPTDRSQPTELFYSIDGTAALVGKLYGSIDLEIIKVEVSILALARLTLIAEAYEAIDLRFTVEVQVEANLTIVFFTVHFSFSMRLDLSTTIGSGSSPPWIAASRDAHQHALFAASRNGHQSLLRQQRTRHLPRRLGTARLLSLDQNGSFASNGIDWTPVAVFPNSAIRPIRVRSGPALTVAQANGQPSMQRIVAAFFVDNGIHASATSARQLLRVAARDSSFDQLAAGVLRWSFAAAGVTGLTGPASPGGPNTPRVTALAVEQLLEYLATETNREAAFAYDNVAGPSGFLARNYVAGFEPARNGPTGQPGTVFPIPAQFVITPSAGRPVQLWNTARVGATYRQSFETYYDQLRVKATDASQAATSTANRQLRAARGFTHAASLPSVGADGTTPLSAVVFGDYFAILARAALQSVDDLLKAYPHVATRTDSLASLAHDFGGQDVITLHAGRGDTLASVAASLGIAPQVVERANPRPDGPTSLAAFARLHEPLSAGAQIQVPAGPTVGTIATANQDYPLAAGINLTIPNVLAQVAAGETIRTLAQTFGFTGPTGGAPNGPAALFSGPVGSRNAASAGVLRSGATLGIPRIVYPVQPDDVTAPTDPLNRVGAMYYVRGGGPLGATASQLVPWYMQQIAATGATGPSGNAAYVVPIASLVDGLPHKTGSTTFTPRDANDTIEHVAQYFTLIELAEVRPRAYSDFVAGITWQGPLQPGTQLTIPAPLPYGVGAGDSLSSLAARFSAGVNGVMTVPALVDRNVNDDVLRPLAVVEVPPFATTIQPADTLATIARRYDLTVEDLADGIATVPGIFVGPTGATMTIPDLASRDVDDLLEDMTSLGKLNQLASTVSRFLLNGMRVAPVTGGNEPWQPSAGLYDVVGQQFAPAPGASFALNFAAGQAAPWIRFYNSPSGPSGPTSSAIDVPLSAAFLNENAPSTNFVPQITYGPTGMTAYADVAVRYATPNAAHWQSATGPTFPGPTAHAPVTRQPSLWFFSPSLLQVTSSVHGATGSTGPFELVTAPRTSAPSATSRSTEIGQYAFGTAVELRIQRVLGEDGAPIPHRYLLIGADETGRELLLAAWQFAATRPDARDRIYLLYPPSGGTNSSGFASDALGEDVFVLRTNLSTVTHPNRALFRASLGANEDRYQASIRQPAAFMQCVWEASVTGSGGFYLEYVNRDGNGFPDALFADGPEARIRLVYLSAEQGTGSAPNRNLFAYNNCAVVGDNVDAASTSLFVQRMGNDVPTRRVSAIPAGMVGFELARVNPNSETNPVARTGSLYHVLSYRVDDNQFFRQSNVSAPIGPATATGATGEWRYHAIVPVAQFGVVNDAPATPGGLPPAAQNPYAGITAPTGPGGFPRLSSTQLNLAFHDVFGNALGASGSVGPVAVPFGYIDDLVSVAAWPGAGSAYRFAPTGPTGIALEVELSLDTARSIASPSLPFATAAASAAADAARYASIFYQVQQRDLAFALESNLGSPSLQGPALKGPLSAFVTKAKVFVDAAASLVGVTGQAAAGATFGGYASTYAVTPGALAEANSAAELTAVFAAQGTRPLEVVQPAIVAAPPGHTLVSLADAAGANFTVNQIAANNATAPLRAGVTLVGIVPLDVAVEPTLAAAAAASDSAIYFAYVDATGVQRETGLVMDNWTVAGLIATGVTVTVGAISRTTSSPTSLADFFAQFQGQGSPVGRGAFAQAAATVPGLVAPTIKSLVSTTYVVPPPIVRAPYQPKPSTLAGLVSLGLGTLDELATANQTIADLFVAGTPILIGTESVSIPPHVDTLADFAHHARVSLAQFGTVNATRPLVASAKLGVPNLTALPANGTGWAGYTPAASDSLQTIAARFTAPVQNDLVAGLNRYLRGILTPGTITIGQRPYSITADDSLDTLFARVGGAFSTFVTAIAQSRGLFATNAAVIVPGPPSRSPASASATADTFGIQGGVLALFEANRSLRGFLRPQPALQLAFPTGPGTPPVNVTISVGANDTLDTLVRRLGDEQQLQVDLDLLSQVAATSPGLITGSPFLLPPNPTLLECTLAPIIPPPGGSPTQFPITTTISMTRAPELIAPDFVNRDSAVQSVSSSVSAAAFARGATGPAAAGTLRTFATQFEKAFAAYRLKCAVGESASGSGTDRAALFAMNFGPSGIADLTIAADRPAFYGLPPVSTSLISGTYPVVPYGASGASGPLGPTAIQHFEGADPQTWLRTFLAATDLVLSGAYAVPAYLTPGPTGVVGQSYDTIVAAKASIASKLSSAIEPILDGTYLGASGQARDALYQQMLQQLESAYQTTAVVQYPVSVNAAVSPNGATWPRLFGPVVNPPYQLPNGTPGPVGLNAFATGLSIDPSYLALVVGGQRGLLEPGSTLTYAQKTHTIVAGDTLASVAGALGVTFPGPTGRDGAWWTNTWVPFVESPSGIGAQPSMLSTTPLPVTRIVRNVTAGEPFAAPAAFFGDPIAFGRANQNVGALLVPNQVIVLGSGRRYTTTGSPNETIARIAATVGATIDDVIAALESQVPPILLRAQTLRGAVLTTDFTLSSAKIALTSAGQAYLTFLLSVADEHAARTQFLSTRFAPTDLEYDISAVPGAGNYESSKWLRLVIPPGDDFLPGTRMPQTQVPIPLRVYPPPPILTANAGTADVASATTIPDAKLWTYSFDVLRADAPQDEDHLAVSLYRSTRHQAVNRFGALSRGLIAALAQFGVAWPQLSDDLAQLPVAPGPRTDGAVQAFAFYADAIARALGPAGPFRGAQPTADTDLAERYEFLATRAPGVELTRLALVSSATGPGASFPPPWPTIALVGPTGITAPLTGPVGASGATAVYQYPPGYAADERLTHRYWFEHRDVARNERAAGGAFVTRNAGLISSGPLGASGPTGAYPTNSSFVYQTPLVEFVEQLIPSLSCGAAIDLSAGVRQPLPLQQYIVDMLNAVVSNAVADNRSAHWIELVCSYAFSTSGTDDGVFATIPLGLRPTPINGLLSSEFGQYASDLANAVTQALPPGARGAAGKRISFALRLFTSVPDPTGDGTSQFTPILSFDNLFIPAQMIAGWPASLGAGASIHPGDRA